MLETDFPYGLFEVPYHSHTGFVRGDNTIASMFSIHAQFMDIYYTHVSRSFTLSSMGAHTSRRKVGVSSTPLSTLSPAIGNSYQTN